MNLSTHSTRRRDGFTLVEMLVVIAIIGILLAILVPAVMSYISKGPLTQTSTEIGQLSEAIEAFKQKFKVDYVPSQLVLCEVYTDYILMENGAPQDNPLHRDSVNYLTRLFPQILSVDPTPGVNVVRWKDPRYGINWNGNLKKVGAVFVDNIERGPVRLEGDQCLVFFLGGIPMPGQPLGVQGWSHNPRDPASVVLEPNNRIPPAFEFPSDRLFLRVFDPQNQRDAGTMGYASFADPWGKATGNPLSPYVYFSNYGKRNGYNTNANNGTMARYISGDCQNVPAFDAKGNKVAGGVVPFYQSSSQQPLTVQLLNPSGFQIISAGQDGKFGQGGPYAPPAVQPTGFGADDQSNFSRNLLGAN
jgi:prepilin-type N-terminal cleavage/methylation domain-containing protein